MNNLQSNINNYINFCESQKRLDSKTIKAYKIDLRQFTNHCVSIAEPSEITPNLLEDYISYLHKNFKPKTVKRKIASLKALLHYFEYKNVITYNPFNKLYIKFKEPSILPKVIPLPTIEKLLAVIYKQQLDGKTSFIKQNAIRDAAVCELLFATGIRISELCSLHSDDVDLNNGKIKIYGKGSKERIIQIGNVATMQSLIKYQSEFSDKIFLNGYFFINSNNKPLSDQAVRRMLVKYSKLAYINIHITPHMFRHTFATSLLDADVDIRYIQEMLGHSSINVTEIYTHVAIEKQGTILKEKHPRKAMNIHIPSV